MLCLQKQPPSLSALPIEFVAQPSHVLLAIPPLTFLHTSYVRKTPACSLRKGSAHVATSRASHKLRSDACPPPRHPRALVSLTRGVRWAARAGGGGRAAVVDG